MSHSNLSSLYNDLRALAKNMRQTKPRKVGFFIPYELPDKGTGTGHTSDHPRMIHRLLANYINYLNEEAGNPTM